MPHSPLGIGIFTIPAVVNIREDVMSLSQELWLPGIAHEFGHQYLPECLRSTIILWAPLFMVLALLEVESVAVLIATVASLVGIGLVRRINIVHEHLADAFAAQLVGKAEVIYSLGVLRDIAYSYFTSVNRMVAIMLFWRVLLVWVSLFLCTGCLQIPATLFALAVMETIVPKHSSLAKRIAFLNQHFNSQVSHGSE